MLVLVLGLDDAQQVAFSRRLGEPLVKNTPEVLALQSIGYNLIPEPATWAMLLVGFAGLGLAGRRAVRSAGASD